METLPYKMLMKKQLSQKLKILGRGHWTWSVDMHRPTLPCAEILTSTYKNGGNKDWILNHVVIEALILRHEPSLPKTQAIR